MKLSDNDLQIITYSSKDKINAIRYVFCCTLDGLIWDIFSEDGYPCTGRTNDANTLDDILLNNLKDIHGKVDIFNLILGCDRGYEHNKVRTWFDKVTIMLPCIF